MTEKNVFIIIQYQLQLRKKIQYDTMDGLKGNIFSFLSIKVARKNWLRHLRFQSKNQINKT